MRCLIVGACVCVVGGASRPNRCFLLLLFLFFGCIFDETRASSSGARQACRGQPF